MVTEKGFLSYNGYTTKRYFQNEKDSNSILSNNISAIVVDESDQIWISYFDKVALTKFNSAKNLYKHYLHDDKNPKSLPAGGIIKIKQFDDNKLWLLTWGEELIELDLKKEEFHHYKFQKTNEPKPNLIPCSQVKEMLKWNDEEYLLGFFGANDNNSAPVFLILLKSFYTI
jgi:hypothetical protein